MAQNNNISTGNSGEYFVAAEFERRGFTVAVPMSNVKDFDLLIISRGEAHTQYAIQVKTTSASKPVWTLAKKNEDLKGKNIFYVFVSLNELNPPSFHIVPSDVVAKQIKESHSKWLNTPGKHGQAHNDNSIRKFHDDENKYLERWDLIKL